MQSELPSKAKFPMPLDVDDTDLSDIQEAILASIQAGRDQPFTVRIPVWFQARIVAWYTVTISREPVHQQPAH